MNKYLSIFFILIFSGAFSWAQKTSGVVVNARVAGSDTIPVIEYPEIVIGGTEPGSHIVSPTDRRNFQRLVKIVKKVYPYALIVRERYEGYLIALQGKSEKERRIMMRKAEDEIKAEFYDDIKKMTFSEGKVLLKLIYRQTQYTSYQLLQDYRGEVRAIFWLGIAKIFGANLNATYDPKGEDRTIEEIIQMIEAGKL